MALPQVSLDDRYALERGRVLMTGIQALVRLPMMQRQRDLAAGLNTAGFISGYRGSPLGGLDQALWQAKQVLEKSDIVFQPGHQRGPGRHRRLGLAAGRPVPGRQVRRRVRALVRQGPGRRPLASTCSSTATTPAPPKHGGVLVVAGDDHACQVLDPAAPVRPRLRRRRDPGAQSRRACRTISTSASTAGRCRATRAAGSRSRRSPTRSRARPWSTSTRTGSTS